jgi:hypothetical protein
MSDSKVEQQTLQIDSGTGRDSGSGSDTSKAGLGPTKKPAFSDTNQQAIEQRTAGTGDTGGKKGPKAGGLGG